MTGDPVGEVTIHHGQEVTLVDISRREDLYLTAIRAFDAAIRTGSKPLVSGFDGLRSLAAAVAAMESLDSGRQIKVEQIS